MSVEIRRMLLRERAREVGFFTVDVSGVKNINHLVLPEIIPQNDLTYRRD